MDEYRWNDSSAFKQIHGNDVTSNNHEKNMGAWWQASRIGADIYPRMDTKEGTRTRCGTNSRCQAPTMKSSRWQQLLNSNYRYWMEEGQMMVYNLQEIET